MVWAHAGAAALHGVLVCGVRRCLLAVLLALAAITVRVLRAAGPMLPVTGRTSRLRLPQPVGLTAVAADDLLLDQGVRDRRGPPLGRGPPLTPT
jgi:hypothetical protein